MDFLGGDPDLPLVKGRPSPAGIASTAPGTTHEHNRVALTSGGAIATVRIMVRSGQKVGLYLGSDASSQFRQKMLFPITVGHNDIRVVIQYQAGLHDYNAEVSTNESDVQRDVQEAGRPDKLDIYKGNDLTGSALRCTSGTTMRLR